MNKSMMIPAALCSVAFVTMTAAPGVAAFNCSSVKSDLDRGRTPQDISQRMGVSESQIQKCQDQQRSGKAKNLAFRDQPQVPCSVV